MKNVVVILLVIVISACGSSNDSNDSSDATVPEEARGIWTRGCIDSQNEKSATSTLEISERTITWITTGYDETQCVGNLIIDMEHTLDYSPIGFVATLDGIEATHAQTTDNETVQAADFVYHIDGINLYLASPVGEEWSLGFDHPFVKQ